MPKPRNASFLRFSAGRGHEGRRRRALRLTAEVLALGALAALGFLERGTIERTFATLLRADWRWLIAALGLELLSLMAFARTQRLILRAAGIRVPASWMAVTTLAGNAISVSLPLVGPEAGTLFTFGRFRRAAGDGARAGWALVVAGLVSWLVLGLTLAAGAVLSGNVVALVAGLILGTVIALLALAAPWVIRRRKLRQLITKGAAPIVQRSMRLGTRPTGDPVRQIDQAIDRLMALHIGVRDSVEVIWFSLVNWFAGVGCLAASILAVGARVPWSSLLLVYVVGAAAGSFNLTPGGLGVVEGALAATLVAAGMHPAQALGSVLIFRIASFWLPALVGWTIFAIVDRPNQRSGSSGRSSGPDELVAGADCGFPACHQQRRPPGWCEESHHAVIAPRRIV